MSAPPAPAPSAPPAGAPGAPGGAPLPTQAQAGPAVTGAAPLVAALTASGGSESAGFLNDIIAQLWPNICVAGADMTKSIVEPMFASMLPKPLNSLHFAKIDLGQIPIKLGNVDVHKMDSGSIKMDLDVDWDGQCDIELDGTMIPKIGVEQIKLKGRLSILLGPLINAMPLIGAAQVAFINPPYLKLKYTDVAAIANVGFIDRSILSVVQSVMAGMAVLPNRFLVKLDAANDWFATYQFPLGILKVTMVGGSGLGEEKAGKSFIKKLMHDEVDCYADTTLGAETWRTKTINNNRHPQWNETHDFLLCDHDQVLTVSVSNEDTATSDDLLGKGSITVKDVLLNGGSHDLPLLMNEQQTGAVVRLNGHFFNFVPDAASLSSQDEGLHGLLTILIASASHISGDRTVLKPSVKVVWGESNFRTAIKTDCPGTDVQNPSFDVAYTVPLTNKVTVSGAGPVRLILLDGETERAAVDVSLGEVLNAPNLFLAKDFQMPDNSIVRAAIVVRGIAAAH